jgi:PAS domain S-box-containing protein
MKKGGATRPDDELTRAVQARLVRLLPVVLRVALAVAIITSVAAWIQRHERQVAWWTYGSSLAITVAAIGLRRSGRAKEAGVLLSVGFFVLAVVGVMVLGGPRSPACFLLIPVALTAALFWSWRAGAVVAMLNVVLVLVSAPLAAAGRIPAPRAMTPVSLAVAIAGTLVMGTVLIGAALRSLLDAVADANRRAREAVAVFRESPDAIVLLDDTGIVRDINPAALKVGQLRDRDVIGRHFAALPVFSGNDAALAIRRFPGLLRGAKRTFALRLTRADGSVFWGDARARALSADTDRKHIQVTIRDVTQRKIAEQRRTELEGQLLKLQRFETIGRISGAVAHDVNNLLTIVSLVASTLRSQLGPEARELADELCDSAARAAKLNRRLLVVGRQDTSPREPLDLNIAIGGMRTLLERLVESPRELVVHLDPAPCFVLADGAQLEQIIINLVTNARDAIRNEGRLTIETERSAESVIVRVSDTGIGIDAATKHRMFEPFFTTKGGGGTGLGLATVRDIVASYGGRIDVDSQPGRGTRFEVRLPAFYDH